MTAARPSVPADVSSDDRVTIPNHIGDDWAPSSDRVHHDPALSEVLRLFELSLSIGTSLDMGVNCQRFLGALMEAGVAAWGSVWVRRSLLPDWGARLCPGPALGTEYVLVGATSESSAGTLSVAGNHPMVERSPAGPFCLGKDDPDYGLISTEVLPSGGSYAVLPLMDGALLKMWRDPREPPFTDAELGQYAALVVKFGVSLQGCIAHASLLANAAERRGTSGAQARMTTIIENTADLVAMADHYGKVIYLNKAGRVMLGFDLREDLSQVSLELLHSAKAGNVLRDEAMPQCRDKGLWEGPTTLRSTSGQFLECSQVLMAHRAPDGEVEYYSTIIRDITERSRLEAELRQSQKMEAVGQLAGGVAHDFNNLLGAISAFAELLSRPRPQAERERYAKRILKTCDRAADLNRQLLTFSRRAEVERTPMDVHDSIDEVVTLLERTIDRRIEIERNYNPTGASVLGDASRLQHLILNLAVNARDAMPKGGTLSFSTKVVEFKERTPELARTRLPPGTYLVLEVADTGVGMDMPTQMRIFEPFFTTKEVGSGTGLGLAVAYGTAKAHGGTIIVDSVQGKGSTFMVYLPYLGKTPEKNASDFPNVLPRGHGHILLVDDEEAIRSAIQMQLEELGYTVTIAEDGKHALLLFSTSASIDLVLLDVVMPKMNGAQTLKKLRELDPKVKVIMMSGYGHEGALREIEELVPTGFLSKPFRMAAVAETLAEALA